AVPMAVERLAQLLRLPTVSNGLAHRSDGALQRRLADELPGPDLLAQRLLRDHPLALGEQVEEHLEHFGPRGKHREVNMPARNDVTAFDARGDARTVSDRAISTWSTALTSETAGFTADDTGKEICIEGAGLGGVSLFTTIAAFISATEITLANAASTEVSHANVAWGGTAAAAAIRRAATTGDASSVFFPPGAYRIGANLVFNVPVEFAPA